MTATDELRRLLDERGIKWTAPDSILRDTMTCWTAGGFYYEAFEVPEPEGTFLLTAAHQDDLTPEQVIDATLGPQITGETSDGYHTFNELYHHRAVLFSVIVRDHPDIAWKARKHHDGSMYEDMFIVGVNTPEGQATYHYDIDPYWDMFECKELDRAPEWDGHTPDDAIARIATLGRGECEQVIKPCNDGLLPPFTAHCSECGDEWGFTPNYCPNYGRRVKQ